jgi:hypothetical protein
MRSGSLHHMFVIEPDVRYRAEVGELDGEPLVLMWQAPVDWSAGCAGTTTAPRHWENSATGWRCRFAITVTGSDGDESSLKGVPGNGTATLIYRRRCRGRRPPHGRSRRSASAPGRARRRRTVGIVPGAAGRPAQPLPEGTGVRSINRTGHPASRLGRGGRAPRRATSPHPPVTRSRGMDGSSPVGPPHSPTPSQSVGWGGRQTRARRRQRRRLLRARGY